MLDKTDFINPLGDDEFANLNNISRHKTLTAGETIFSDKEKDNFFAIIVDGIVKLTKSLPDGRKQIVGLLFATDIFAREYEDRGLYFAVAATDLELCYFSKEDFEASLSMFPTLQYNMIQKALKQLDLTRDWMLLLGKKTATEKVASFLIMIEQQDGQVGNFELTPNGAKQGFQLPLTRSDIADFLGVTVETVSRQITKLKTEDIISVTDKRNICVLDADRLEQAAGAKDPDIYFI